MGRAEPKNNSSKLDYDSPLLARARVSRVIDLGEVLKIKVGVDLSGCDVRVAQQLLNAAKVLAGFEDVGGEGMAEHVRMDVDAEALALRPLRDELLH